MTEITSSNIKDKIDVGDEIMIDGVGPYEVRGVYWLNEDDDLGVDIDDSEDEYLGIICDSAVRANWHEIVKV